MKKLLLSVAALMVAVTAFGQGQVNFSNRVTGQIDAPVFLVDGTTLVPSGARYQAQIYGGSAGTAESALTAQGASANFLLAGYFIANARQIGGVPGGSAAAVQVRVWDTTTGTSWDNATIRGESNVIDPLTLVAAPGTPPNLSGLQSFSLYVVPEPSTIALGVLGAAALLFARRRKE
jgi:hypothetical protein